MTTTRKTNSMRMAILATMAAGFLLVGRAAAQNVQPPNPKHLADAQRPEHNLKGEYDMRDVVDNLNGPGDTLAGGALRCADHHVGPQHVQVQSTDGFQVKDTCLRGGDPGRTEI